MIMVIITLLFSLALIWKGSDWLTDSLIPLAKKLGTSYIAVTTLIVSLMLSIPEMFSSIYASILGHVELGLGVIIGSVMANIGLTVGLSAAIKPLTVEKTSVLRDGIFMVVAALVVLVFGTDLQYTRSEGIVLLLFFIPYAVGIWFFEKWRPRKKQTLVNMEKTLNLIGDFSRLKIKASAFTFLLGSAVLIVGAYLFSTSLIQLNDILHIPEILLGITAGAIGPALPNIAAAIQGTRKGFTDAAVTETFGSNIFTLLITLGVIILFNPFTISAQVFYFDLTWMIIIHLLLLAFIFKGYHYEEESITRYEGWTLMLFYLFLLVIHLVI